MKTTPIFHLALTLCLIPATFYAQSNATDTLHAAPVNYYAEFADLMHGEMSVKAAPVATPSTEMFPAFVHYREVLKGQAENFPAYFETIAVASVPAADAVFAIWKVGQGSPHEAKTID